MSLMTLGFAYVIVLLTGLVLISELRTGYGQRELRERRGEVYSGSDDVHNASFMGTPIDTALGCGGSGYGHGAGCDGGGGHGA